MFWFCQVIWKTRHIKVSMGATQEDCDHQPGSQALFGNEKLQNSFLLLCNPMRIIHLEWLMVFSKDPVIQSSS